MTQEAITLDSSLTELPRREWLSAVESIVDEDGHVENLGIFNSSKKSSFKQNKEEYVFRPQVTQKSLASSFRLDQRLI